MPRSTARSRPPHAGDPIHSAIDAIAIVSLVIHRPLQAETIAFLLDDSGRSDTITIISGTTEPDSVLAVAECMARAASTAPALCGLVVASVRPGTVANAPATLPGDIDRWLQIDEITESHGIELVEWFVVGPAGVDCPRDLLGDPERW